MRARIFWVLLPATLVSACGTDMHAWDYQTGCNQAEVRSAVIRDLCSRFGTQTEVQRNDGNTVSCEQSGFSPSSVRAFVSSAEFTSSGTHPFVYVYLTPWNNPIQINVEAAADAKSLDLARTVSATVGQSLNHSNCPWTLQERQFSELPKLG